MTYFSVPENYDGSRLQPFFKLANKLEKAGLHDEAAELRAAANNVRPELTWYGSAMNQTCHAAIGAMSVVLLCAIWREVVGEMPHKTPVFFVLFLVYAVGIEVLLQKWLPGDSWIDALCYTFGLAIGLAPFSEVAVYGRFTTLDFDHWLMGGLICALGLTVGIRAYTRFVAGKRHQ